MIIDSALYTSGRRIHEVDSLKAMERVSHQRESFAWIGLAEPSHSELEQVLGSFSIHETAMEDAVSAQQRAKLEENGEIITFVIRTVFYDDLKSSISTGELICFIHADFIIIVRHGDGAPLVSVRSELEHRPDFLALGPFAVLHGVLDKVIDEYTKIASELEKDVIAIENEVFSESRKTHSRGIYSLKREVIEYRHAIEPLILPLQRLVSEGRAHFPDALRPFYRDISDQLAKSCEHANGMDSLLTAALQADLAQVQVQQNNDVRRVSAWVALAAFPTMVAGIYGMNFEHMPELQWRFGYPLVIGGLVGACGFLYYRFKKAGWL
ncbi:MAG: magnesium and cobalt transport protein CorA [Actinobacteria bacterium]|nr:magnesium and cobalt transport protein CorA [Actinomycetota bacterium]